LNPFLFIPFIIVPVVAAAGSYLAIASGLVPYYGGITVPWTTPPIISGFITGGWRAALLQLVIIVWSIVGYYPFIKKMDQDNMKLEQEAEAAHHAE
jgi:PTS system cellobiose-specific IIC component